MKKKTKFNVVSDLQKPVRDYEEKENDHNI